MHFDVLPLYAVALFLRSHLSVVISDARWLHSRLPRSLYLQKASYISPSPQTCSRRLLLRQNIYRVPLLHPPKKATRNKRRLTVPQRFQHSRNNFWIPPADSRFSEERSKAQRSPEHTLQRCCCCSEALLLDWQITHVKTEPLVGIRRLLLLPAPSWTEDDFQWGCLVARILTPSLG